MCFPLTDIVLLKVSFFSYAVWCVIGGGEICSESCDCLGSITVAGTGRDSVFQVCVLLRLVLNLDDQTLLHLIAKGVVKKSRWRRARNLSWCVEDGGCGVWSSDVHRLVQNPVSVAQMQFTHATRSPRAR